MFCSVSLLGRTGAEAMYDDLLARNAAVPGGTARLALGRARAMLTAGKTTEAFAALRDLAKALDKPAPDGKSLHRTLTIQGSQTPLWFRPTAPNQPPQSIKWQNSSAEVEETISW